MLLVDDDMKRVPAFRNAYYLIIDKRMQLHAVAENIVCCEKHKKFSDCEPTTEELHEEFKKKEEDLKAKEAKKRQVMRARAPSKINL